MPRQKIPIDERKFRTLCGIQCTLPEIAAVFDCHEDTIRNWCQSEYGQGFSTIYKEFSQTGKSSLRHSLFNLAKKNASVAIYLSKQYLGMSDTPVPDNDNEALQAIGRLNQLFDKARKRYDTDPKYDAEAASSEASERQGAERLGNLPPASEGVPPAATAAKPAKAKAPRKGGSK